MKKILFLVSRYPKGDDSILEKDMVKKFSEKGNIVKVIAPVEESETEIFRDGDIEVLYIKTPKYKGDIGIIKKGIAIATRPFLFEKEILKKYGSEKFDLIVGYTPFMSNPTLFKKLKNKFSCKTMLFLWDIFPQNAKDLNLISNKLLLKILKMQEEKMYKVFDKVVCNCDGQIAYLTKNSFKNTDDICLVRNCEYLTEINDKAVNKKELKEDLGYSQRDIISIFGGNMGIPQQLENIVKLASELKKHKHIKFILVGNGTEKDRLKNLIEENKLENIRILESLERIQYENLLKIADIALISLNKDYTVPNFPAKITGYTKLGIPIFASLDSCSINFLGKFIEDNKIGVVAKSKDITDLKDKFLKLIESLDEYSFDHFNKVYKENFNLEQGYNIIEEKILSKI